MLHENTINNKEFDLIIPKETERKFMPIYPATFADLRYHETAVAIEQVYLSSPNEPFSLRLRATASHEGIAYEATLKDRGVMQSDGLSRLEVPTPISPELYQFYTAEDLPTLRKIRAEPFPQVTVDFYEDGSIQIESENEEQRQHFVHRYDNDLVEITGLPEGDNERRAFAGREYPPSTTLDVGAILRDVYSKKSSTESPVLIHIGGRSGSGKSTIVREVSAKLTALGISNSTISTDDYHRGHSWLSRYNNNQPWQHWDDPIVYDTEAVVRDLERLRSGQAVVGREIDWVTVEPRSTEALLPTEVLLVEGIYATDPEVITRADLVYELQTPLATCVGRRLLRDLKERPQFADPAKSLAYMLTDAEPAYRKQRI